MNNLLLHHDLTPDRFKEQRTAKEFRLMARLKQVRLQLSELDGLNCELRILLQGERERILVCLDSIAMMNRIAEATEREINAFREQKRAFHAASYLAGKGTIENIAYLAQSNPPHQTLPVVLAAGGHFIKLSDGFFYAKVGKAI